HDHKFDPFTTRDFYSFAAFFADIKETAVGVQEPFAVPSEEQVQQMRRLDEHIAALRPLLDKQTPELDAGLVRWEEALRLPELRTRPKNILEILLLEPGKRTDPQKQALAAYYSTIGPELEATRKELADLTRQKEALTKAIPTTLISVSVPPRVMRILPRGNWLD